MDSSPTFCAVAATAAGFWSLLLASSSASCQPKVAASAVFLGPSLEGSDLQWMVFGSWALESASRHQQNWSPSRDSPSPPRRNETGRKPMIDQTNHRGIPLCEIGVDSHCLAEVPVGCFWNSLLRPCFFCLSPFLSSVSAAPQLRRLRGFCQCHCFFLLFSLFFG